MNEHGRWRWGGVFRATYIYFRGVFLNLCEAVRRWQADDAGLLAAAIAYYMTVSLFPLLLVLIAGLGVFLRFTNLGHDAEQSMLTAIEQTTAPAVADQVANVAKQVQRQALISGPLGIFGALLAALAVFSRFDRALDRIWNVPPEPGSGILGASLHFLRRRLRAFVILVSLGCVVMVIFLAVMCLTALRRNCGDWFFLPEWAWQAVEVMVSVVLNTLVFTMIFRWLAKVPVGWLKAVRGGLLAALAWELGRVLLAALLIGTRYSAYGVVGSLLAVMLWTYYAASVLLLGAEYVQVIRLRDRVTQPHAAGGDEEAQQPADDPPSGPTDEIDEAFDRWQPRRGKED